MYLCKYIESKKNTSKFYAENKEKKNNENNVENKKFEKVILVALSVLKQQL